MAYVIADPEMMTAAATDLATIGSNVNAAHVVAAARTTSVIPAAADEVSAGIAQLFSHHAANYQAMAAQAAAFNDQFVQRLRAGAFSYAGIEGAIVSLLQDLSQVISNSLSTPLGQNIELVFFDAVILAWYAAAALQHFVMTGQILSFSAFRSSLFPPLLGP